MPRAAAPAPQAKPAPQAQTSVRTRGGGVQSAPKPSGLLSKIGSGIKRVAGGVADAATGNKFDFDKRGGQKPAPKIAGSGNVRGSGARANRAPQAAPQRVAQGQPAPLRGQQRQPQQGQAAGTVTRTGAQAAAAAEKVGGTQNIPASQKVTPTSSTSGPGRGSIKFSKGALSKLVSGGSGNNQQSGTSSGMRPTNTGNARRDNFNQKVNTLKNKQKFGGTGNPITVGDKTFKPGDKGYKDAFNTVSSAVSGAVKTAQAPQSGNNSSSSSKTIGVNPSPGRSDTKSLVNNNKSQNVQNAKKVTKQMNQVNQQTKDFEIPEYELSLIHI